MDSELIAWKVEAGRFPDSQLMAELRQLARMNRKCEAHILVLLAEVDERELFLPQGYSSLFRYAVAVLRMSEAEAYLRIGAARAARSYPVVLKMLAEGALNLSTVKLLAPLLTAENHVALLERARDKSKREVELLVAEIAPKPDVQTRIRKLPERCARTGSVQAEHKPRMFAALNQSSAPTRATAAITAGHIEMNTGPRETTIAADIAQAATPHAAIAAHAPLAPNTAGTSHCSAQAETFAAGQLAGVAPHTAGARHGAAAVHAVAALAPATNVDSVATAELTPRTETISQAELFPLGTVATEHEASAAPAAPAAMNSSAAAAVAPAAAAASAVIDPRASGGFALEAPRASCAVLSPGRYRLELTVDQSLFDQMMTLKHLLKHRVPSGDLGAILRLAIADFSERLRKQRFAELSTPAPSGRPQAARKEARVASSAHASRNGISAGSIAHASRNDASAEITHASQSGIAAKSIIHGGQNGVARQRSARASRSGVSAGPNAYASRNGVSTESIAHPSRYDVSADSTAHPARDGFSAQTSGQSSQDDMSAEAIAHAAREEVSAESIAQASRNEVPTGGAVSSLRGRGGEHGSAKVKRRSRYVPRAVVREVFARDGAQCTFVSTDGIRCAERGMLELHHVKAFAWGGPPTLDNMKVVCRSHNGHFAAQDFGAAHMRMMREQARCR